MFVRLLLPVFLLIALALPGSAQEGGVWAARRSGWQLLTPGQRTETERFADGYKAYLNRARTALTSTRDVLRLAQQAGFQPFSRPDQVRPGARLVINGRDRALALAVIGKQPLVEASRLVAAHHDSPHIDLKARPVQGAGGFALFKTIYYGGLKKYQWSNLPLALLGRVDTVAGKRVDVEIGIGPGDPVFVIPDNAPHSDTDLRSRTYTNVLAGEEMDPVAGSVPGERDGVVAEVVRALTTMLACKEEDFVSAELQLVPAAPPADVGIDRGLVGGYGQDDRVSVYCAVRALLAANDAPPRTAIVYLSNNEEVGSVNNTGAASQFLNSVYAELVAAQRGPAYSDIDLRRALRRSEVVSADANDGVNPLFPGTSEATNAARLGFGVAIKKYGRGFDANSEYIARIRGILDRAGIPWQTQTPKVDVGGGGTIGGFMSREEMEVIDIGIPLLSMHSPFEMASKVDIWNYYRFLQAFLLK